MCQPDLDQAINATGDTGLYFTKSHTCTQFRITKKIHNIIL